LHGRDDQHRDHRRHSEHSGRDREHSYHGNDHHDRLQRLELDEPVGRYGRGRGNDLFAVGHLDPCELNAILGRATLTPAAASARWDPTPT
jgi:hypothetical protein